jgi:hypothetical protein
VTWPLRRIPPKRHHRTLNDQVQSCVYAVLKTIEPFEVQLHADTLRRLEWEWRRTFCHFDRLSASSVTRQVGTRKLTFAVRDGLRPNEVAVTDGATRLYFLIND